MTECTYNLTANLTIDIYIYMISAFVPGEAPKKVFSCIGMNVSKAKIEENKLKAWGKELTYYLDPKTGEKLSFWDNPWTGEKKLPGNNRKRGCLFVCILTCI